MKSGMWLAILGVLGLIAGVAMYSIDWHRTIGLGGVGLGVLLIVVGLVMSRGNKMAQTTPPQATQAPQTS